MEMRFLKRINKEVENVLSEQIIPVSTIKTTTTINPKSSNNELQNELITIVEINNNIEIIFGKNYPFTKTEVFYNKKPYQSFLKTSNAKINALLLKTPQKCLCCTTIFCDWRLTYSINDFLVELKNFRQIKIEIKTALNYNRMLKILQKKYEKIPIYVILNYLI